LQKLDFEGHSITFWNLQFKIRLVEQQRCAHQILRRENLACLRRIQLELVSLRADWLGVERLVQHCRRCGKILVNTECTGRPQVYCDSCFKLHRRTYFQTRYLLKSKQNVSVKKVKQVEV